MKSGKCMIEGLSENSLQDREQSVLCFYYGAGDEDRTRDIKLGMLAFFFYHTVLHYL